MLRNRPDQATSPTVWAAIFAIILWGLYPFRVIVHHYPWRADAIKWVTMSSPANDDWLTWVFSSHHFVGYRPITALSFSLNYLIGGWNPEVYRLTDATLHGLSAVMLTVLFGRLTRQRTPLVLIPLLIFVGHPGVEEALPYLARRSYLLATLFSTTGLVVWIDSLRSPGPLNRQSILAVLAFAAALLSNESAYVVLPLLPLLALHFRVDSESISDALSRAIPPILPALPVVAARMSVLGVGGYNKHYFAYIRAGKKVLRQVKTPNYAEIIGAAHEYLFFPASMTGEMSWVATTAPAVFLVASFYAYAAVVEPLLNIRDKQRRLPLVLFIWFFGYSLLYALSRTWFWRQAYPMIMPLALLYGVILVQTWIYYRKRPLVFVGRLIPQAALLFAILSGSHLFAGMSIGKLGSRFAGNEFLYDFQTLSQEITPPAHVWLVLPVKKSSARNTLTWLRKEYPPELHFSQLITAKSAAGLARVEGSDLIIHSSATISRPLKNRLKNGRLDLRLLHRKGQDSWLIYPSEKGVWRSVHLE